MTQTATRPPRPDRPSRALLALLCAALLVPGEGALLAQEAAKPATTAAPAAGAEAAPVKLPPDQLDSLVAPIALYPDPLLAQTLVAATYPLEIVQLQQFLAKNPKLKDKALADAVAKQPWDPSIQSMAAVPEVVKRLADDIQWTTQLGDAFLDQQNDVMDAVQRMRKKAQDKGALTSNEQQKVETQVVEQKTVIVVQQTNPEVIYVPTYSPTVVYPPPVYPYPPIYYPPPPPYGAALVSFTAGVMIGAAVWGGSCCGCGWGGSNTVNVNVNNNFNKNTNVSGGNVQHNPQHRGGAPYSNSATANKYGGSAQGGAQGSRGASPSASTANRGGGGGGASPSASTANRGGGGGGASPSASTANRGGGGGGASPSASTSSRGSGGGGSSGAFGGGSGGYSGSSAKASSSRGSSSMSGGGGRSGGGGGGRGGGGRR
jgi:hypothetical protein